MPAARSGVCIVVQHFLIAFAVKSQRIGQNVLLRECCVHAERQDRFLGVFVWILAVKDE